MNLQRIVIALKPWERALPLAPSLARQLAQHVDARMELVGSVFNAAVAAGCDRGEPAARESRARAVMAARVELERLAAALRESGRRVVTRIVWGVPPYESFLAAADESRADLIVVGVHEHASPRLTDTDWQLMRRSRRPLLLVKNAAFSGYRTILAAVDAADGEEDAHEAVLDAGRCFARAFAAVELEVVESAPVQGIIDADAHKRAELVVVGATQSRGLPTAFVGNTAELVAGELPCDVLIVPSAAQPLLAVASG
jgi:nucleotide-binding universal stress UspA family protein